MIAIIAIANITAIIEIAIVNCLFLIATLPNIIYLGGVIESTISNIIPTPAGVTMKVISNKTV